MGSDSIHHSAFSIRNYFLLGWNLENLFKFLFWLLFSSLFISAIYFVVYDQKLLQSKISHLPKNQHLKKVKLFNRFQFPISLFYEDGEAGTYLEDLGSSISLELLTAIGTEIYATKMDGISFYIIIRYIL